jgi:deoxyribonuclease V
MDRGNFKDLGKLILATDVHYQGEVGYCAAVIFEEWHSQSFSKDLVVKTEGVQPYRPGEFFKRELPCITAMLGSIDFGLSCIVVDGYVFLDGKSRPGLGKYLYDSLDCAVPIIGVAKSAFDGLCDDFAVLRGQSKRPLYVTSIGCSLDYAKNSIISMSGDFRIPSMLKHADQLCRSEANNCAEGTTSKLGSSAWVAVPHVKR